MHGGSHRHLDRLQVEFAGPAAVLKDDPHQPAYFAFDLLPDRFRRFFPAASERLRQALNGRSFHSHPEEFG
jgi:hypothetical protein